MAERDAPTLDLTALTLYFIFHVKCVALSIVTFPLLNLYSVKLQLRIMRKGHVEIITCPLLGDESIPCLRWQFSASYCTHFNQNV